MISEVKLTSRVMEGKVVSDAMDKTITVLVTRTLVDPDLGKVVRKYKKFKAHDEKRIAKNGDWVEIKECRPLSKTKHMMLTRIITVAKAKVA